MRKHVFLIVFKINVCIFFFFQVKPSPPANVRIVPEDGFPRSLMVNWTHPIHATFFKLKYHIRYCQAGCSVWQEVRKQEEDRNVSSK